MVHHPLEAPGSVTAGGRGEAVLLDVDGEDRVLGLGQLALVVVSAGGEEDTQPGLEVDGLAGGVVPAGLDAVVEDESPWLAVQHVCRGGVDEAGDDLEGDKVCRAVGVVLGGHGGQTEDQTRQGHLAPAHPAWDLGLCKQTKVRSAPQKISLIKQCQALPGYEKDIEWEKPVRVRVPSVCVVRQTAAGEHWFIRIKIFCRISTF